MMSPLGMVSVAAVTVVKVACVIGAGVAGYHLAGTALALLAGGGEPFFTQAAQYTLGFLAGVAGFELSRWAEGKIKVIEAKDQQQEALRRLEARQGMAR